ncbi:MAG TPA: hypothetical protein VJH06_03725 [Candidatus Paceibacterota bacterium]
MKIFPKENLLNFSLPLPIFNSLHIADAICQRGDEFDVLVGMEKKYAEQLKQLSEDESDVDLQNYTGDKERFVVGSYEDWYKKNRTPFILVHKQTDTLAAIIWFGPKPLGKKSMKFGSNDERKIDSDWHTVSFRAYPLFRGRGMMVNFTKFVFDIYRKHFPNSVFWTGSDDRNTVFLKFISELGFKIDEENSDLQAHWQVMIK